MIRIVLPLPPSTNGLYANAPGKGRVKSKRKRAASKRNLSDRRWDIRGKLWDKDIAKATFPDHDFDSAENIF